MQLQICFVSDLEFDLLVCIVSRKATEAQTTTECPHITSAVSLPFGKRNPFDND